MTRIAKLTADLSAIETYPLNLSDLKREMPLRGWPALASITSATLEGTRYVLVEEVAKPAAAFGETVIEASPVRSNGSWRQAWTVQSITLAQAKQQLAQMVCDIYWERMQAAATPTELNGAGTFIGVVQARQTRYATPLAQAKTNIQGAGTIAEAFAIYQQLVAFT